MKKLLLSFLLTLMPIFATAEKVEVDGIWYKLIERNHEAEVTYGNWEPFEKEDGRYSGDIVIPASIEYDGIIWKVTSIGFNSFRNCHLLMSISIPYGLVLIDSGAFGRCKNLETITIPETVNRIGVYAFDGCTGLKKVNISDLKAWLNIKFGNQDVSLPMSLGSNPLESAKHLYLNGVEIKDLVIPEGVASINDYAFRGCEGLTSVKIPNSVINVGYDAFACCNGMSEINIPNSVTNIGEGAFRSCSSLASITIPNSVTSIGMQAFNNCSALTSINIPNCVKILGGYDFYGCSALASITIPNSVTSINNSAFECCSALTSINIPNSVKYIGKRVFANCDELKDVYCWAETLTLEYGYFEEPQLYTEYFAFQDSYPQYMTLHVPANSIEAYRSMPPWSQFGNIVALTDGAPQPTGIKEVRFPMNDDDTYYDLFGRKVIPNQKGVYIHNRKKQLIK